MKLLDENMQREASRLAEQYRKIEEICNYNNNIKENYKKNLISFMLVNEQEKVEGIKLIKSHEIETLTVKELGNLFNTQEILDYIVINIDLELTARNLKLKTGLNDDFVRKVVDKIKARAYKETFDLEVLER